MGIYQRKRNSILGRLKKIEDELMRTSSGINTKVSNLLSITNKIINENILIPYRKFDKWGFCTPDKKIVIDCIYDDAYQFIEDLARVKQSGKYGFINRQGFEIIPFEYDRAYDFHKGFATVVYDKKWGKINKDNFFEENKIFDNNTPLTPIGLIECIQNDYDKY
jgi:hypothetical protein